MCVVASASPRPGPGDRCVWAGLGGHQGPGGDSSQAQGAVFSFPLFGQGAPPNCTSVKCPVQSLDLPLLQQSRPGQAPFLHPAGHHPRLYSVTPCPSWGDQANLPPPAGYKPAAPRPRRPPAQLAVPHTLPPSVIFRLTALRPGAGQHSCSRRHVTPTTEPAAAVDLRVVPRLLRAQRLPPTPAQCASAGPRTHLRVLMAHTSPGRVHQGLPRRPAKVSCHGQLSQPVRAAGTKIPESGCLINDRRGFLTALEAAGLRPGCGGGGVWRRPASGLLTARRVLAGGRGAGVL